MRIIDIDLPYLIQLIYLPVNLRDTNFSVHNVERDKIVYLRW